MFRSNPNLFYFFQKEGEPFSFGRANINLFIILGYKPSACEQLV